MRYEIYEIHTLSDRVITYNSLSQHLIRLISLSKLGETNQFIHIILY